MIARETRGRRICRERPARVAGRVVPLLLGGPWRSLPATSVMTIESTSHPSPLLEWDGSDPTQPY